MLLLPLACVLAACESPGTPDPKDETGVVSAMPKSAKRGVSFSFTLLTDLPLLSPYISWDYNWGNTPSDEAALWFDTNDMDYCPMCWNGNYNADRIRAFVAAHPKTQYLLGFNEPNLTDQANMTPQQAAELWPPVVALAKELNLKLVSPAMNYGNFPGYSDPIKWLDEFFAQPGVSIDDVYAISIHCYMASPSSAQGFIESFEKYNKPIWLTEFCAWQPEPGSVNTQMDYMCSMLHYLERHETVERYAWFMPRMSGKVESVPYNQLLTHDYPAGLTELGKLFCLFSPMNDQVWLRADRPIRAHEYVSVKNNAMTLRPSADEDALVITNFGTGQEISYQVYTPEAAKEVTLQYCSYSNSICEVLVDGVSQNYLELPRNGSSTEWTEANTSVQMPAGKHTLTLSLFSGSCYLKSILIH